MAEKEIIIFRLGNKKYGVEINQLLGLEGYVKPETVKRAPKCMAGVATLRDELMPIVSLHTLFGIEEEDLTEMTRYLMFISSNGNLACKVDEVLEIKKMDEEHVHDFPQLLETEETGYVKFVVNDGDELILVLNPDQIVGKSENERMTKVIERM